MARWPRSLRRRSRADVLARALCRVASHLRAPDFPIGVEPKEFEKLVGLADRWGEGVALSSFAPSRASDPLARESWARLQRAAASPGMVRTSSDSIPRSTSGISCRRFAPRRSYYTGQAIAVPVACGRYLEHIPGARYVELEGDDHMGSRETRTHLSTRSRSS